MTNSKLLYITGIILSALFSNNVSAQSIDYSSYETLFKEPVTASANGTPQRLSDVPLNMVVISADEIAASPAHNIPELLRYTSGVNVVQSYAGGYDVSIRGYNQSFANRILVLVNGRQVYLDLYGYVNWDLIPVQLSEIKQIEIVEGPNTALFGFNAVSGVINIITVNPLYDDIGKFTARYGNKNFASGSYAQTVKPNDKIGITVSAGGYTSDDAYHAPLNSTEFGIQKDSSYSRTARGDMIFQVADNIQAGFEFSLAEANTNQLAISYSPANSDNSAYSMKSYFLADTDYGLVEGKFYSNRHDADWLFSDKSDPVNRLKFKTYNTVNVASLSDTVKIGTDNVVRLSGEYRYNKDNVEPYDRRSETNYEIKSLSALWSRAITPALTFNIAGRFDRLELGRDGETAADSPFSVSDFNNSLNEFSYNTGFVYNVTDRDTARLQISRGIDIPSLTEFGIQLPVAGGTALYTGNPYIKASTTDNYEISLNHDFPEWDASLETAVFYQISRDIQNGLAKTIAGVPAIYLYDNVGDSTMTGFELDGKKRLSKEWNIGADYNIVLIDDNTSPRMHYDQTYPEHIINLTADYRKESWSSRLNASFRSRVFGERENVIPGQPDTLSEINDQVILSFKTGYDINSSMNVSLNGITSFEGDFQQTALGKNNSSIWAEMNIKF